MRLSPTVKGLITGACMIASSVGIYYYKGNFQNNLQYITYTMYIAGILWTLGDYSRKGNSRTFKNLFTEGFKCFIVVTLLMVAFTWIFIKINPGMKDEMAMKYKTEITTQGNYTRAEIDKRVNQTREYYLTGMTAFAIFGYLLIGSIFTVIGSFFLRKETTPKTSI